MAEQIALLQAYCDGSMTLLWIYPTIWALILTRKIIGM